VTHSLGQESNHWHPVSSLVELLAAAQMGKPLPVRLLGHNLVLWLSDTGSIQAWADRCPHRGAQLSLGRICGQQLACAYHGWQFDAQGLCRLVPAQPDWQVPNSHRVQSFEVKQAFELIWVKLEASEQSLPNLPISLDLAPEGQFIKALAGPYLVNSSAPRVVENFLDMTHFGFVHDGSLGVKEHAKMPAYEVQERGAEGLSVIDAKVVQPQAFAGLSKAAQVSYRYNVIGPYTAFLSKQSEQGETLAIALFNCPLSNEETVSWFYILSSDLSSKAEEQVDFQNLIFAQDKPIVESQSPKALPIGRFGPVIEKHGPLDRVSAAYRRYLQRLNIHTGTC
jgi:phenylpropionate dioxygenase-like ring-hydroxylating dioxygenase large terminal subunit